MQVPETRLKAGILEILVAPFSPFIQRMSIQCVSIMMKGTGDTALSITVQLGKSHCQHTSNLSR